MGKDMKQLGFSYTMVGIRIVRTQGARETAWWLRALAAFGEDPGSFFIPSTYMVTNNHL